MTADLGADGRWTATARAANAILSSARLMDGIRLNDAFLRSLDTTAIARRMLTENAALQRATPHLPTVELFEQIRRVNDDLLGRNVASAIRQAAASRSHTLAALTEGFRNQAIAHQLQLAPIVDALAAARIVRSTFHSDLSALAGRIAVEAGSPLSESVRQAFERALEARRVVEQPPAAAAATVAEALSEAVESGGGKAIDWKLWGQVLLAFIMFFVQDYRSTASENRVLAMINAGNAESDELRQEMRALLMAMGRPASIRLRAKLFARATTGSTGRGWLEAGTQVVVIQKYGRWALIAVVGSSQLRHGWVKSKYLRYEVPR